MKKASRKTTRSAAPAAARRNTWDIQDKALKEFERGVNHFHKQNYSEALDRFQAILKEFPEERELVDRAQVYARVCAQMSNTRAPQPRKPEDCFYFGVMKANEADYDEAVKYLDRALQANPRDEKVHYVMASTLALKGERDTAIKHLREAIQIDKGNRIFARNDPDFEPIRDDEAFQNLIHPEEI